MKPEERQKRTFTCLQSFFSTHRMIRERITICTLKQNILQIKEHRTGSKQNKRHVLSAIRMTI
ncbi:hypothetical protein BF9343_4039 [Bacteroides fragilis NCTC 9343]|uniref:Uncharacterized protein n=1 Tax=Bacteroides fragilis (strain ATCC 25285 / DSM 2151 / CCUG 4856 / JCM 11019 / LMG 10263 / NCTC 9343 / Onslow / VPI 2553 / EN-2) TaxID=272559 RepID=Q5L7X9_BACFN|nr:hypothetical protein BF9343_4039 [Bacteroides fragilis NCTC 9343]